MTSTVSPASSKPSGMTRDSRLRQSRNTAASRRLSSDADWSRMPVGAPTTSFSARCPTSTNVSRGSPSCHTSLRANATALSMAADDERPAPTGTFESMSRSAPGTAARSAPNCPSAQATPRGHAAHPPKAPGRRPRRELGRGKFAALTAEGAGAPKYPVAGGPGGDERPPVDGEGQHEAVVVVGVLTDQVDPP